MNSDSIAGSPEAPFLHGWFARLQQERIRYCVLRDWEALPESTSGHDLDVLVDPAYLELAFNLAKDVAVSLDGRLISFYRRSAIIVRFLGFKPRVWGVAIDLFSRIEYRSLPYYSAAKVLSGANTYSGIRVAAERDSAQLSILKECLANGKDKKGYAEKALRVLRSDESYGEEVLSEFYGSGFRERFTELLENIGKNGDLKLLQAIARKKLLATAIRRTFPRVVGTKALGLVQRMLRIIRPPGICVAILGTDGAGKSTIIDGIRGPLESALHTQMRYEHLRPNVLPSLAGLLGKKEHAGPVTDPHTSESSGWVGSLLRLAYYTVDYVVGYWVKVRIAIARRPCLFVFDRYFYDNIIDPKRSCLSLPGWIVRLFGLFVPDPDLVLCLGADPAVIHSRKLELPLTEVERQVGALRAFCDSKRNAVWVDTGGSVEESIDRALDIITERMARRYEGCF